MNHREEALKAIGHVKEMLAKPELGPLEKRLAIATLEHAAENVSAIEELKRKRRNGTAQEPTSAA